MMTYIPVTSDQLSRPWLKTKGGFYRRRRAKAAGLTHPQRNNAKREERQC